MPRRTRRGVGHLGKGLVKETKMSQPTDEAPDPELAQVVEQLDRMEATLDEIAEVLAADTDSEPGTT